MQQGWGREGDGRGQVIKKEARDVEHTLIMACRNVV